MSYSRPSLRVLTLIACATAAAAIVGTGGCSHGTSSTVPRPKGSPTATPSPTPTPSPAATANVFVSMAYASMQPTNDPTFGFVDGYAQVSPPPTPVSSPTPTPSPRPSPTPTQTPGPSAIVTVPCNVNIQFMNFDSSSFHTASVLAPDGNGPFPKFFNNHNGPNPSVSLTPLSDPNFSTGFVVNNTGSPGRSAVYFTGSVDNTYYVGDFVNYNSSPSMRTAIIVTGC
jgi:hypothetical protein